MDQDWVRGWRRLLQGRADLLFDGCNQLVFGFLANIG
jgi:hypothetical protein